MFGNASFHFKCIWIKSQHWWNWRKTFNEPNFKRFLISSAYVNWVFWEEKSRQKKLKQRLIYICMMIQTFPDLSQSHFFHPYLWHFDSIGYWVFSCAYKVTWIKIFAFQMETKFLLCPPCIERKKILRPSHQSFYLWSKGVTRSKFIELYFTIYIIVFALFHVFGIRQLLPTKFCKKTPSGTSVAQNLLFSQIDIKRAKYKNLLI